MVNVIELFFLISFLSMIGIFLYKFYNTMNVGFGYDIKITFILWAGYLISWFVNLVSFLADPTQLIYRSLFLIISIILGLISLFTIVEILLFLGKIGTNYTSEQSRKRRFSNQEVFKTS